MPIGFFYSIVPDLSIGQYKWNPLDQLENFTNSKGETYNYIYDYAGLRTKKVSGSDTTSYYYSNNNLIEEEKGTTKSQYIRGHALLAKVIDGKYYYYFYNGHGDVVQITDEAGNIVNKYTYDEWGNITSKEEKIENAITYAGQYYDKESNLYYLRARYYDPALKRFISRDSYEGQLTNPITLNLYSYCYDNPIHYTDPSGHHGDVLVDPSGSGLGGGFVGEPYGENGGEPGGYIEGEAFEIEVPTEGITKGETEAGTTKYVNLASKGRTEHILFGDATGGGHIWPGAPGKTPFPKGWSGDKIMNELSDIVTDPNLKWVENRVVKGVQRYEVTGIRDGVKIKVVTDGKHIITAFPIK